MTGISIFCDGCGRETDSTTCREVDGSLFRLCYVCDPYSDASLAATVKSIQDELADQSAAAKTSADDFRDDDPKLSAWFRGRYRGLEDARRRLARATGGLE